MAPSAHDVIWAGTGEPWLIRPYYAMGDGVYKSADAGRSWQHMGLEQTGHIARIIVAPHDTNVVFVCAIGQAFRPQHERGIFRTSDGGKTWPQRKLIESDPEGRYHYTAIHFVGDAVLLAYCAGDNKVGDLNRLRIRRIPLDWLRQP